MLDVHKLCWKKHFFPLELGCDAHYLLKCTIFYFCLFIMNIATFISLHPFFWPGNGLVLINASNKETVNTDVEHGEIKPYICMTFDAQKEIDKACENIKSRDKLWFHLRYQFSTKEGLSRFNTKTSNSMN